MAPFSMSVSMIFFICTAGMRRGPIFSLVTGDRRIFPFDLVLSMCFKIAERSYTLPSSAVTG
eukprot:scaffold88147_cov36-Attheya_sp.AAC.1